MPISFEQAAPMAPAVTAGAAAAEFAQKGFPNIAQIYENAARLRAQGGGGGGGGGGGPVYSGGPIQVLPTSDYGALAQVEQQANRQQRAADLGAELQWDPVGHHIQMQEDFRREQTQQAQAYEDRMLRQLNPGLYGAQTQRPEPRPGPTPQPVVQFTKDDEGQLNRSGQSIADVRSKYENGDINLAAYYKMREPLQQQFEQLTAKQRAAQDSERQQGYKQAVTEQANQRGLLELDMSHAGENGYRQIPDLPTPIRVIDKHTGRIHYANELEMKAAADAQKDARTHNSKLAIATIAAQQKAAEADEKHVIEDRKVAHDEVTKEAGVDPLTKQQRPIKEEDVEARRSVLTQRRMDAREQRNLEKNANPQVRAAYIDSLDSLPKADGKPDYNSASNAQLAKIGQLLADPKSAGVMRKEATEGIAKIRKILQERVKPAPTVQPPPPMSAIKTDLNSYQGEAQGNLGAGFGSY